MADKTGIKIAMVDVQQLVANTKEIAELRQQQNVKNLELQSWTNAVNAEIAKQTAPDARVELIQKNQNELNLKKQTIAIEHQQKLQQIDAKLTEIIAKEAKAKGYDFVFAKGTVLFGATDITADIIKKIK